MLIENWAQIQNINSAENTSHNIYISPEATIYKPNKTAKTSVITCKIEYKLHLFIMAFYKVKPKYKLQLPDQKRNHFHCTNAYC